MGGPPTLLVVDDDASLRLLVRVNLELDGFRVVEAPTLADARAILEQDRVDVALIDVHVGSEDGLQLAAELRAAEPRVPTVLLTGSADLEESARRSVDAVVGKPFVPETLSSILREIAGAEDATRA